MISSRKRVRDYVKLCNESVSRFDGSLPVDEVLKLVESYRSCATKFDESVDISVGLGVDPKRTEFSVKTSVVLPHGNGKKVSVMVFASGDDAGVAKKMGATYVGLEDMIDKVVAGDLVPGKDFTSCVATLDAMTLLSRSKAVRILGVAGVMPNAKVGTVAKDIAPILGEVLSGRIEIRSDRSAFIKASIGRVSFATDALRENLFAFYNAVKLAKPAGFKGNLFDSVSVSSTMMGVSLVVKMSDLYARA